MIATHAPILLAYPDATIYELSAQGIRETAYEDTSTFSVTRAFILRRQAMLEELLAEPRQALFLSRLSTITGDSR